MTARRNRAADATRPSTREADLAIVQSLIRFVQWRRLLAGLRAEPRTFNDADAVLRRLQAALQALGAATPESAMHVPGGRVHVA